MNLALFDFDGTITDADIYSKFIRYSATKTRFVFGGLAVLPHYCLYRLGLYPAYKMRPRVTNTAFKGRMVSDVVDVGQYFAETVIPLFMRDNMLAKIHWHLAQGDKVIVVSASLDLYLKPWCDSLGIELLCSELEVINGRYSGQYQQGDCSRETKAKRIKDYVILDQFAYIYAYGDTPEDLAMLALADEQYMQGVRIK